MPAMTPTTANKPPELTDSQILMGAAADLLLAGNHDAYARLVDLSKDPQQLAALLQQAAGDGNRGPNVSPA